MYKKEDLEKSQQYLHNKMCKYGSNFTLKIATKLLEEYAAKNNITNSVMKPEPELNDQSKYSLTTTNTKPDPHAYGYISSTSFDDGETGWCIEGGEEAYYEALQRYESAKTNEIDK